MGNISRDTFDGLKQYVGVRLQQGVPLVDADWNELEDIRRFELRAYLKWFVGDGVPAGNNGFAIQAIPAVENDFLIVGGDGSAQGAGRCLVQGLDVFNDSDLRHSEQLLVDSTKAGAMGVDAVLPLTNPLADIDYIVYLDVWEREIFPGEPSDDQDIFDRNLINEDIGVPTCTRLKREWVVRTIDAAAPAPAPPAGHLFYPLARLVRRAGDSTVNPGDIIDLRRTGLTLPSQQDINQLTRDAFGAGYALDGDGQANLKLSLRETINSLLRGEVPTTPPEAVTLDASSNALPRGIRDLDGNTWWFWFSNRGGGGLDVWYNRYDAANASWDGETQLSVGANAGYDFSLILDLDGNILVFWDSTSSGNRDIWYDRYNFSSGIWEGNTQLSTSTTTDHYQSPVVDQAGNIWVFWESGEGGDNNIWYNRYNAGTASWDGETQLTTDVGSDQRPSAIVDQDDNIWVFWSSNRSGNSDIWYKRYTATTASWGSDNPRTFDAGGDGEAKAIVDSGGSIWLFWLSDRTGTTEIWYRHYYNGSWGSETQLTTSQGYIDSYYSLHLDAYGDLWVIWSLSGGNRNDVWYTRNSNGSWDLPRNLTHDMPNPSNRLPSAITDSEGDIRIFWSTVGGFISFDSWHRKILTSI